MIREKRNKEKLASYYRKFMEDGVIDPNVHPWVAESWQRCRAMKLFFNDTATTEIYTLSLHDALPIIICPQRFFPMKSW